MLSTSDDRPEGVRVAVSRSSDTIFASGWVALAGATPIRSRAAATLRPTADRYLSYEGLRSLSKSDDLKKQDKRISAGPRDIAEKPLGAFYVETRSAKGECPLFGQLDVSFPVQVIDALTAGNRVS
jgi:hypothetical protein